jgi:hypothetical protein
MAVPGPTNGLHCGTRIGGISTKFTGLNSRGSSVILAWMEKHASHDMAATQDQCRVSSVSKVSLPGTGD